MKNIATLFEQEEEKILQQTEKFYKILTHLRYEGKVSFEKNLKAVHEVAGALESKLERHKSFQERVLFRFLEKHIPKHEAAIRLLETEHEDIAENQKKLKVFLQRLSKDSKRHSENGAVYQTGIYLVALLRHHIKFENKSLRKSFQEELNTHEKKEVMLRANRWLSRFPKLKSQKKERCHE